MKTNEKKANKIIKKSLTINENGHRVEDKKLSHTHTHIVTHIPPFSYGGKIILKETKISLQHKHETITRNRNILLFFPKTLNSHQYIFFLLLISLRKFLTKPKKKCPTTYYTIKISAALIWLHKNNFLVALSFHYISTTTQHILYNNWLIKIYLFFLFWLLFS